MNQRIILKSLFLSVALLWLPNLVKAQYCASGASSTADSEIDNVSFNTINNNTAGVCATYSDFTSMSTNVTQTIGYPISVTLGTCGGNYTKWGAVYIDWNGDQDFNDAGEDVWHFGGGTNQTTTYTTTIAVPATAMVGTTRMRVIGKESGDPSSGCATYTWGETEDYSITILPISGIDIAATQLLTPATFVVGNNTLQMQIQNLAADSIVSGDLSFRLDAGALTTENWTTGTPLTTAQTQSYTFTNQLNIPTPGVHYLELIAQNPNGVYPDNNISNDTFGISICTGLSGNFTLGGPIGANNFVSFADMQDKLKNCGIAGNIYVAVQPGVYMEKLELDTIPGNYQIVIDGIDASLVTLTSTDSDGNNHTVSIDNTKHITIKNMTIEALGTHGYAVHLRNAADSCMIDSCVINMPSSSPNNDQIGILAAGSSFAQSGNHANYLTVSNTTINGGYAGIRLEGWTFGLNGNKFLNNTIHNTYYHGIYFTNLVSPKVNSNVIDMSVTNTSSIGIYGNSITTNGSDPIQVNGNKITNSGEQGIYLVTPTGSGSALGEIINNMIGGGFRTLVVSNGLHLANPSLMKIYHNSVLVDFATGRAFNLEGSSSSFNDIRNNTFSYTGLDGYAMYITNTGAIFNLDYNNYYTDSTTGNTKFARLGSVDYSDLTALQGASGGYNTNSKSTNPLHYTQTDLHSSSNTLNDNGFNLGIATDIDGQSRSVTPDIGADEFTLHPNDVRIVRQMSFYTGCGYTGCDSLSFEINNVGTSTQSSIPVTVNITGPTSATQTQVYTVTLMPEEFKTLTFSNCFDLSTLGFYDVEIYTALPGDGDHTNDTMRFTVESQVAIASFPYVESFESGANGWISGGENSSWALGAPTGGAYDGTNVWATNLTGFYNSDEYSWVQSPCFNISSLTDPWLSMQISYDISSTFDLDDGIQVQYTIDDGASWQTLGSLGDPYGWYNSTNITSFDGVNKDGWRGNVSNTNWINARHSLSAVQGASSLKFRVLLASDASTQDNGIKFDYFVIGNAPQPDLGPDGGICDSVSLNPGPGFSSYFWSNSTFDSTLTIMNGGQYWVFVTDSFGIPAYDTVMYVNANPSVNLTKSSVGICSSDSVTIYASGNYQTIQWSTMEVTDSITVGTPGTYYAMVVDTFGCMATDTIVIDTFPTPNVELGPNQSICIGDFVQLDAGNFGTGTTYQWNTNAQSQIIFVATPGTYTVTVFSPEGCPSMDSVSISVLAQPGDILAETQIDTVCNSIVSLDAGFPGASYLWSTGDTTQTIDVSAEGWYTIDLSLGGSCVGKDSVYLNVDTVTAAISSLPIDSVDLGDPFQFTGTTNFGTTFKWDFGDGSPVNTSQNPSHTYSDTGEYTVQLIVCDGNCCDTATYKVLVKDTTTGITQGIDGSFVLYPNPTTNQFTLDIQMNSSMEMSMDLYDIRGKIMKQEDFGVVSYMNKKIDVSELASGVYILRLKTPTGIVNKRLIIKRN